MSIENAGGHIFVMSIFPGGIHEITQSELRPAI
jgi:hypothetical protein